MNHETKIVIAGYGGQGVVLTGHILTRACMIEDKNVTMMVSYGAEMRGGTASSLVVIADGEIASPVIEVPDIALVLNQPSVNKFESILPDKGRMVINTSLVDTMPTRSDLVTSTIDASNIATTLGTVKVANMVALGAFAKVTGLVKIDSIAEAIRELIGKKNPKLVDLNIKALNKGVESVAM